MSAIAVVGNGYVGSVVAACLAHIGHDVVGVEVERSRLEELRAGRLRLVEPSLEFLVREGLRHERLRFTDDAREALERSEFVFLCVGTPSGASGRPDLNEIESALRVLSSCLRPDHVLVTKSTVPIGTGVWLASLFEDAVGRPPSFPVVSNPEFLREGTAVDDFLYPDRIVLGSEDPRALEKVAAIYRPIVEQSFVGGNGHHPPLIQTSLAAAEMIKYAANAFLATKISFINEIANLCERIGCDVRQVATGIGLDSRIGTGFLDAGIGWGGSCFGKDLRALVATADDLGYDARLLRATLEINASQRALVVEKLQRHLGTLFGRRIALLGLAFKPGTEDIRDAPSLDVAARLLEMGATVTAHDPVVRHVGDVPGLRVMTSVRDATERADGVVLMTAWDEYRQLDLGALKTAMRGDVLIDGRNVFHPTAARLAGFRHEGVGRAPLRVLAAAR